MVRKILLKKFFDFFYRGYIVLGSSGKGMSYSKKDFNKIHKTRQGQINKK